MAGGVPSPGLPRHWQEAGRGEAGGGKTGFKKNRNIFKNKKIISNPSPDCDLGPVSPLQPSLQVSLERTAGTDEQGRRVLQRLQPHTGGEIKSTIIQVLGSTYYT